MWSRMRSLGPGGILTSLRALQHDVRSLMSQWKDSEEKTVYELDGIVVELAYR